MGAIDSELEKILKGAGADLVGFADLRAIKGCKYPFGVSVAVRYPAHVIESIQNGPSMIYFEEYHRLNALLNEIVLSGEKHLKDKGFQAIARTTTLVRCTEDLRTEVPHKTVATRAGLGWIGKCALLVTRPYGSALRISSILTDAELTCAAPTDKSFCGDCEECVSACPAGAVTGKSWTAGTEREVLYDAHKCGAKAREISLKNLGKEITICGICINVCPFTRKYLSGTN